MPQSPTERRQARHTIGATGRRSEKLLAKKLGAKQTAASGAVEGFKGDLELPGVLVEAKSTVGSSISVMHRWLAKISAEARAVGKRPALSVSFVTEDGRPRPSGEWVLVPLSDWQEMRGEL